MAKKDNTRMTSGAAALSFRQWGVHAGLNVVYTHLNRSLEPNRQTLYRQHYAHGTDFVNASINYGWHHHLLSVNGETAIDGHGHLATLNAVAVSPTTRLTIMALQRFYSYRYTSLHGHSMSDAGRVQNESGIYLGLRYTPWRHCPLPRLAVVAQLGSAAAGYVPTTALDGGRTLPRTATSARQ